MTACAMVRRLVMGLHPAGTTPAVLPDRSSSHKRQARVGFLPRRTNPDMLGIFGDRHRTGRTREKVQVVDVISWAGDHWVISAAHQNCVPISGFQRALG